MSFILSDLVVESIIRDGLADMRESLGTSTDQIDDIFGELTAPHLEKHYGEAEIAKIKNLVKTTIRIVHGYTLDDVKVPTISLNMVTNSEVESMSAMDDMFGEIDTPILPRLIVGPFDADSYDNKTGVVIVNTANPDLANVRVGQAFIDGDGVEFTIIGGITNVLGDKRFSIGPNQTVNLSGCKIKSSLKISRKKERAVRDSEAVQIGIISEEPLIVKYLYTIIKYFLVSRKYDMIVRGLGITTYDGTDFNRYQPDRVPDNVFIRTITVRARDIEHTWNAEKLPVMDNFDPGIKVLRDLYPRDDEDTYYVKTIVGS